MNDKNKMFITLLIVLLGMMAGLGYVTVYLSPVEAAEQAPTKWQKMMAIDPNSFTSGKTTVDQSKIYVVAFHPQGATESIDQVDEVTITFSEPVAPLQKISRDAPSLLQVSPAVRGEGLWKTSTTYCFRIDEKLKLSSNYTVRFIGYTSFSGKTIDPYQWNFSTPTINIQRTQPYHRERWQTLDQKILVDFSQDVDPNMVTKYIQIMTPQGKHPFTVRYANKEERKLLYYYDDNQKMMKQFITIVPQTPLPIASDIKVHFLVGLPSTQGNIGMLQERELEFRTYEVLRINPVAAEFYPDRGINVEFTNPVQVKHAREKISFLPTTEIDKGGDWNSAQIDITGKYTPGRTYTLIVPADLTDQFGNTLGQEQRFTAKCLDYTPYLYPPAPDYFVYEDYLEKRLPVNVRNVNSTDVFYRKLERRDIINLYDAGWTALKPAKMDRGTCNKYQWNLNVAKNRAYTLGLDLQSLQMADPGFYYLYFSNATRGEYYNGHVMQLTDVALVAKYSPTQVFLMPFNMKTGEPIPYMDFTIESLGGGLKGNGLNQEFKGRQNGVAIFQPRNDLFEKYSLLDTFVFSEPNKSFIWGRKYDMFEMWQFSYEAGINYNYSPHYYYNHLFTFTDKYLYKGGQTVQFKGIFRQSIGGKLFTPKVSQIEAEVFNSRGESIKKFNLPGTAVTAYGSFAGNFDLPADAPTGFYRCEIKVVTAKGPVSDSLQFSVQEYKPVKFEVDVTLDQQHLVSGQNLTGTINSRYLFGTPMKNAQGSLTCTIDQEFFTPTGWEAYTFGTSDSFERETIYQTDFTLDDEGNFKFNKSPLTISGKNSVRLSVYGEVKDKDNNTITSSNALTVHRGEYYIGVKTGSYFFKQGQPGKLQVVTVTPAGKPFPNSTVHLSLVREEWKSFQMKDASGSLRWDWKKLTEDVLKEDIQLTNGTFEKQYKFDKTGYYQVYLEGEDNLGNTISTMGYFYVTGSGYVSWGVNEGRTIDLVTDKKSYQPGDQVELLIKSPFESATVLVTVERERVMWSKVMQMTGNANTVQIPVEKEYMPNVYINVIILKERTGLKWDEQGNDIGKPEFYAGYTAINVDASEKQLTLTVTSDQASYEPGQPVKLDVLVTDKNGTPVQAEVCLSVVDKGVLNLVGYQLPDPFEFFWAKRQLDVKTVSTLNDVLGRQQFKEKGENPGGGGGVSPFGSVVVRKNFKESAYYTAFLETGTDGKATVTFQLPDNLTTFKAMAVAGNAADMFGRGNKDILVKKNVILKPAVPNFTRPGDRMSAGVTVTNNSDRALDVAVEVQSQEIRLDKGEKPVKTIQLAPAETKAVWYRFKVDKMGTTKMTFKAVAGPYSDGLYLEIPTRVPQFLEAVASFGRVEDKPVNEQVIVPTDTIRELDKVEISLASTSMVGVKRNFDLVQEYPYDCLEQRISKEYPLLGAGDFLINYGLVEMTRKQMDVRIQELLKSMPQYQDGGAFKYYPDSCCTSPYLTCYAMEFILDAKSKGFAVDAQMVKQAEEFLKSVALWTIDSKYPYSKNVRFLVQAYAIYVLSKDKILVKDAVNNLFEVRDRIPLSGIAYLVKALDKKNNLPDYMQPVLAKIMLNKMKEEPTMIHFENFEDSSWCWVHESNVKTTSIVLEALLDVYGRFPYAEKISRWLVQPTLQKRYLSTQENIRLFMAFEKYYRVFESETPDFVAEVLFNDTSRIKEIFKGREMKMKLHTLPLTSYSPGDGVRLSFKKQGVGMMYYLLRMKYYPAGEVEAIDRGFKIVKSYKTLDGKVVLGNTFKAGEKYIVEVTVETKMERPFVMLDDPLPAGMSVLNPDFKSTGELDSEKTTRTNEEWDGYWGGFYRSEIYFDRVQVFADYLERGAHTWKYLVVATNAGSFSVPSTVAMEMYNPEVFGRNDNRSVTIK